MLYTPAIRLEKNLLRIKGNCENKNIYIRPDEWKLLHH